MKAFFVLIALVAFLGSAAQSQTPSTKKHGKESAKQQHAQALYVCPMHPEVTSDKPGRCPKCKMELVKKEIPKPAEKKSASPAPEKNSSVKSSATYTCPMHPDVVSSTPGTCPRCKMDLVKNTRDDK
jgi:membrane fusion protein, copper/silver efflux system